MRPVADGVFDLTRLGAFAAAPTAAGVAVRFGFWLPGLGDGYSVEALVIHADDQFKEGVNPSVIALSHDADDFWTATTTIGPEAGTSSGTSGRYAYRYRVWRETGGTRTILTNWVTDPFATMTDDIGQLSAFETPQSPSQYSWTDDGWVVPDLQSLIVYELDVEEFNGTFAGVIARLDYLSSLGVKCLELMPVTSVRLDFDWGYDPLHYFAPNERWGGGDGLKQLINAAHGRGIAVILDVVYQHVSPSFAYSQVYADAGTPSPMIGAGGEFGPPIDFTQEFAVDFVRTVGRYWLREYHVDGFRYDEVTDLYDDSPTGRYATIAYDVYNESLAIPRFTPSRGTATDEYSRVIQCPESLGRTIPVLTQTYSSTAWDDGLLNTAQAVLETGLPDAGFAETLDLVARGFPTTKTVHDGAGNDVEMPVRPLQYIGCHDASDIVAYIGHPPPDFEAEPLADQTHWFKLQPLVIALYTGQGIPMLWQGQEFADNWVVVPYKPGDSGNARVHVRRDVHWEYFYGDFGPPLVTLHRALGKLRNSSAALQSTVSLDFSAQSDPTRGVIAYGRAAPTEIAVIALNFSDGPQTVTLPAPAPGTYREQLDGSIGPLKAASSGDQLTFEVPSNYGYVLLGP